MSSSSSNRKNASAGNPGELSSAETKEGKLSAEALGEKSSAETQGEYSSVEIPGEISSAGIEGEKTPASINSRTEERLHKEFGEISRDPLATNMDFSLKNDNLYEWEVLIGGTPFLNGPYYSDLFILTLKFPPDYPAKIPRVTFRTTRAMSDWTLCVVNFQKLWDEAGSLSGAINALAYYLLRNENSSLPKQDGK